MRNKNKLYLVSIILNIIGIIGLLIHIEDIINIWNRIISISEYLNNNFLYISFILIGGILYKLTDLSEK